MTLLRLGGSPAASSVPAPQPGITTRRSTRSAASRTAAGNVTSGSVAGNVTSGSVAGNVVDEMASDEQTVDSQEMALVTQQANPIFMLDQDQVFPRLS